MRPAGWIAAVGLFSSGCAGQQSMLEPHGPAAQRIADLWWLLLGVSVFIFLAVTAALLYALLRRRGEASTYPGEQPVRPTPESDRRSTRLIMFGAVVITPLILFGMFAETLGALGALTDPSEPAALTVEVTGHQWWWEVQYFGEDGRRIAETANEIHIPVGRRVEVRLLSDDVIHSFWVPQLQGKLDNIPGKINVFWIAADTAGVYRGQCAEYCGLQHGHMAFRVVAQPEPEFDRWLVRQRAPASEPADSLARAGRQVFLSSACAACHAVRGTPAVSDFGPDLTHVASRLTLAAGTLPNTKGHMGGWIANPQVLKPGAKMPAVPLSPGQFGALLHFLVSLE